MIQGVDECGQATKEELRVMRRRCWNPSCKRRAWLECWDGWKWCGRCWLRNLRWDGASLEGKWLNIKTIKLYWPR